MQSKPQSAMASKHGNTGSNASKSNRVTFKETAYTASLTTDHGTPMIADGKVLNEKRISQKSTPQGRYTFIPIFLYV